MSVKEVKRWEAEGRLFDSLDAARAWERRHVIKTAVREWTGALDPWPGSGATRDTVCVVLENTAMDGSLKELLAKIEVIILTEYPEARKGGCT